MYLLRVSAATASYHEELQTCNHSTRHCPIHICISNADIVFTTNDSQFHCLEFNILVSDNARENSVGIKTNI